MTKLHVLIIDDEKEYFENLEDLLSDKFHLLAVYAEDGEKGLQKINNQKFDIIIIDNQMPKLSGIKTIEIIRSIKACSKIPIFLISGNLIESDIERMKKVGVKEIYVKPINYEKLIEKISTHIMESLDKHIIKEVA